MKKLKSLFKKNRAWAENIRKEIPDFFLKLSKQQKPRYLWIGCSDSRVPANEIVGMMPGEIFVHRNIANLVVHTDINCLSVIQYAVEVLKIKHIIVCGHYGCGGVRAALEKNSHGLIDNWLRNLQDIAAVKARELNALRSDEERVDRLCELNIVKQILNICDTTIVRDAWKRKQAVTIHGWIYSIRDGLLHDLGVCPSSKSEADKIKQSFYR